MTILQSPRMALGPGYTTAFLRFIFIFYEDSFSPVHTMARGSFACASTITGNPQIWRHDLDCHGNYARKGHEICDETGPAGKQFAKHHNNKVNLMAENVTV